DVGGVHADELAVQVVLHPGERLAGLLRLRIVVGGVHHEVLQLAVGELLVRPHTQSLGHRVLDVDAVLADLGKYFPRHPPFELSGLRFLRPEHQLVESRLVHSPSLTHLTSGVLSVCLTYAQGVKPVYGLTDVLDVENSAHISRYEYRAAIVESVGAPNRSIRLVYERCNVAHEDMISSF